MFNVPKYKTVLLSDKTTLDGEKWSKGRTKDAIAKGIHVYLTNEYGAVFEAKTWEEVEIRKSFIWVDPKFRERKIILSGEK